MLLCTQAQNYWNKQNHISQTKHKTQKSTTPCHHLHSVANYMRLTHRDLLVTSKLLPILFCFGLKMWQGFFRNLERNSWSHKALSWGKVQDIDKTTARAPWANHTFPFSFCVVYHNRRKHLQKDTACFPSPWFLPVLPEARSITHIFQCQLGLYAGMLCKYY